MVWVVRYLIWWQQEILDHRCLFQWNVYKYSLEEQ